MKIKLITQLCMLLSIIAMANPAPFELEIEKTTIQELKQKYNVQKEGINKYSQGEMYSILDIGFDGIQNVTAIFDKNKKIVALLTTFPKSKFNYLMGLLQNPYQLVNKQIPFVGNKYAKFIDDNTEIVLDAPHLSFSMNMDYMSFAFRDKYQNSIETEKEEKVQEEQNALFGKVSKKVYNNQFINALLKKCNNGNAEVCTKIGNSYLEGYGIKQDYNRAVEFYTKACKLKFPQAYFNMGIMYDRGYGIEEDKHKAIEFYTRACDNQIAVGCYNAGNIYNMGDGVKEDKLKAIELYNKACNGGEASGCHDLGVMYYSGEGVKEDIPKAIKFYTKACDGKEAKGCYNLGVAYFIGDDKVKKDNQKAKEFFYRACNLNYSDGCGYYQMLNK